MVEQGWTKSATEVNFSIVPGNVTKAQILNTEEHREWVVDLCNTSNLCYYHIEQEVSIQYSSWSA